MVGDDTSLWRDDLLDMAVDERRLQDYRDWERLRDCKVDSCDEIATVKV